MIAFTLFAVVASFTPGPTNILAMANSARRGFGASLPLVIGAASGVAGMVWAAGLGLAVPLRAHPMIHHLLSAVGIVWLGWLAWQLFRSAGDPVSSRDDDHRAPGALTGAALQLVNPKAWMMALAVVGVFTPDSLGPAGATWRAVVFLIVGIAGVASWAALGSYGIGWLRTPPQRRLFNRTMAVLLIVAAGVSLLV
ncbi:LysE family translocator [Salinisphaera hydrothermalis]|uniref:LysE family translocator n=1 Tax=Salinisphaera hydrothermalis TaxID=563188 RepID=UPI0033424C3C